MQGLYGTASGRVVLGRGAGGDRTLELDRACESAILGVLEQEAPYPHALVSEEAGTRGPDDAPWRVVIDPLDGSLNAKRGLEPFCASIAVADGGTLGSVRVGYIEDYTHDRVFSAVRDCFLRPPGCRRPSGPRRPLRPKEQAAVPAVPSWRSCCSKPDARTGTISAITT